MGDEDPPLCPTAMLLLALAAPVFADSKIFLKNPGFLAFGVESPPNTAVGSSAPPSPDDQGMADDAPCREVLWLEWYDIPVNGVSGLGTRETSLKPLERNVSTAVFGLSAGVVPLLA